MVLGLSVRVFMIFTLTVRQRFLILCIKLDTHTGLALSKVFLREIAGCGARSKKS